ncbi:MAG: hypothetical protein LBU37_13330 [Tannerellaceae bacterium]|jgi:hypothetical protein|nr:hypothetical protein [Tannerellaceae bacterium]
MNIDELLDKYFEGETSKEEERQLRAFFASGKAPQRLAVYKPMFACFDEEIRKEREMRKEREEREIWEMREKREKREKSKPAIGWRRRVVLCGTAAACLALALGITQFFFPPGPCLLCSGNYVVVNGRCYTDIQKVKELAFDALQEVATPATIEDQLNELNAIFSDDD